MEQNSNPSGYQPLTREELDHRDRASSAMILGIIGVALFYWPVLSIASIVLGAIALRRSMKNRDDARAAGVKECGMNVAGYVSGLVSVIGGSLVTLFYLVILFAGVAFVSLLSTNAIHTFLH